MGNNNIVATAVKLRRIAIFSGTASRATFSRSGDAIQGVRDCFIAAPGRVFHREMEDSIDRDLDNFGGGIGIAIAIDHIVPCGTDNRVSSLCSDVSTTLDIWHRDGQALRNAGRVRSVRRYRGDRQAEIFSSNGELNGKAIQFICRQNNGSIFLNLTSGEDSSIGNTIRADLNAQSFRSININQGGLNIQF